MSPRRGGGSLNGSTILRQMFLPIELSVSVIAEFSAPERCEAEGTAEQRAGCSRGAGTVSADSDTAAALICLGLEHRWLSVLELIWLM